MKKFIYLAIAAFAVFALTSCPGPGPGPQTPERTIELTITGVEASVASLTAIPSEKEDLYYGMYATVELFNESYAGQSDAEIIEGDYDYFVELAQYYTDLYAQFGYTEVFTVEDFLFTGDKDLQMEGLTPATDYVMWAAYLDGEGNNDGVRFTETFKTEALVMSDQTFTIEETTPGIATITPSGNDLYYASFMPMVLLEQYDYTVEDYYPEDVEWAAESGYLEMLAKTGVGTYDIGEELTMWNGLEAGSQRVGVGVACVDLSGNILSKTITTAEFTIDFDPSAYAQAPRKAVRRAAPVRHCIAK